MGNIQIERFGLGLLTLGVMLLIRLLCGGNEIKSYAQFYGEIGISVTERPSGTRSG